MSVESELKLPVEDRAGLRQRLQIHGAELLHEESLEDNRVWDRGDELRAAGGLLRLRSDGQGTRITWKGPASFDEGVKIREEYETTVGSASEMTAILESLGYEEVRRYQKYREEWRLGDVEIALDRTPIGDFVEFEGESATEAARQCGCDPAKAIVESYVLLYEAYRQSHPDAPTDMIFAEGKPLA